MELNGSAIGECYGPKRLSALQGDFSISAKTEPIIFYDSCLSPAEEHHITSFILSFYNLSPGCQPLNRFPCLPVVGFLDRWPAGKETIK